MSDGPTGGRFGMERRTFLTASAGTLGMAALLSRMSSFVSAETTDHDWITMESIGSGEYAYTYDAPAPIHPEGLLGTVDFRVLDADSDELLTHSVGLGIDPNGREFRFEDDATDARLRGVVVSQDGQVSAAMRGDNLTDGATYKLVVEAPNVTGTPSFETSFVANGGGGSTVFGPTAAPTDFPTDESDLRLTVSGTRNGTSTGEFDTGNVSGVDPVEEPEPPEGGPGSPVTENGVTLRVLEPFQAAGEIEFVGGQDHLFRVSVDPDTDVTVQLRITFEPPEVAPEPVAEGWHELAFDGESGRFTGEWFAPGTAEPEGLLGGFFFRVRDRNAPETVLTTFEAELGIDAPGREFGFTGTGGEARLRGGVVVLDGMLGIAIRGDNLTDGGEYAITVSEPGGASKTVSLDMNGNRGSAIFGPAPTDLPDDESLLRFEVTGPEFTENNVEEPGPLPPADPADPAPTVVPVDRSAGDYALTVFDPEIAVLDPGFEVEVVGDDVYPIELEVSREGEATLLTDADVVVEWQAIADGEVLAPPEEGQEPSPEPGVWYPMEAAQSGTKLLGWQAPPVVDPEGVEGLLQIRAGDGDDPVATFSSELGVAAAGIEFGVDDPSGARMDGTFTVEATADSRIIGGSLRGRFLTPGAEYTVTFADASGAGTPVSVTETADAVGELAATFGPLDATGLPLEETDVTFTVTGQGFGDDVEVETAVIPGIDSDTPIPVRSADGEHVLWVLEPETAGPTFPFETVVFGGTLAPFRAKVTDGSLPDDATLGAILDAEAAPLTVEWNLIVDGLPQEPVSIAADDPPIDPAPGQPPATPELGFTDVVFAGLGAPAGTTFSLTVSGQVTTLANAAGGTISPDGTTASGQVTDDEQGFRFTGAITSLTVEDPAAVEVRMRADGETTFTVVDPATLADPDAPEPTVPTPPDDAPRPAPEQPGPTINTVVISSEDIPGGATYRLVVDGVITPVSGAGNVSPDGTTATGTVESFKHAFDYVGSITSLTATGYVEVFVNGVQVSSDLFDVPNLPDDPAAPPSVERKLVIDSSGLPGDSTYEFTVAGGTITAVNVDDGDAVRDGGTRATGRVSTGKDVYRYTGTISGFHLQHPSAVRLYVDGVHVPYEDVEDHEDGPDVPSPEVRYYQVDLVVGRPNEVLGETYDDFYSPTGRLIAYLHGTSEQGKTRRALSGLLRSEYDDAIETTSIEVSRDGKTARATVTVHEGESLTLSLVSYLKPGAGFSRSVTQTMYDAETVTLSGGSHTFTVDLPRSQGGN